MPVYDFRCDLCRKKFSLTMGIADYDKKKIKCPKCRSKKVTRVLQPFFAVTSKKS
jgi:putative FmdB family regulatory protein